MPNLFKLLAGHDENSTNVGIIVVEWMEIRRCYVQGAVLIVCIEEVVVEGEEVDVVHDHVVTLIPA